MGICNTFIIDYNKTNENLRRALIKVFMLKGGDSKMGVAYEKIKNK